MVIPDAAITQIERWCEQHTPAHLRDQMRLELELADDSVTIADCRPPWDGEPGEWTRLPFARLCYEHEKNRWTLYWADSDDRWHRYDDLEPTEDLYEVLAEIDEDPTSIFFG